MHKRFAIFSRLSILATFAIAVTVSITGGEVAEAEETWGAIDKQGNWVVQPHYHTTADALNAERSVYKSSNKSELLTNNQSVSTAGAATESSTSSSSYSLNEKFQKDLVPRQIGGQWFYVDDHGEKKIILPDSVSKALPFIGGYAFVAVGGIPFKDENFLPRHGARWRVIDCQGKFLSGPEFLELKPFFELCLVRDGLIPASVQLGKSKKYGFIDARGQMIIAPQYTHANFFHDGFAEVSIGDASFSEDEFKNRHYRSEQITKFFDDFKVIGMPKQQIHTLLGTSDTTVDALLKSISGSSGGSTSTTDRDKYMISDAKGCGNALFWLAVDYKNGQVRRYRYESIDRVGGWVYDGRSPSLELEYVDTPRQEIDPDRGVVGLRAAISRNDHKISVSAVTPELPAAEAGILQGDQIVSVDERSVKGDWYDSFYKRLGGRPGTSVIIKIRRGNVVKDVKIDRLWVGDIADFRTRCEFLCGAD
jgi:hypothetical protein